MNLPMKVDQRIYHLPIQQKFSPIYLDEIMIFTEDTGALLVSSSYKSKKYCNTFLLILANESTHPNAESTLDVIYLCKKS